MPELIQLLRRWQYEAVRILLGLFLAIYLFSNFLTKREEISTLARYFHSSAWPGIELIPSLGILFSILFAAGVFQAASALGTLLILLYELLYFPLIKEVSYPYLSVMLFIYFLFTKKSAYITFAKAELQGVRQWRLPLMICVYLGFTIAGISKLFYPGWLTGAPLEWLCLNDRFSIEPASCGLLSWRVLSWFTLFAEVTSLPLALVPGCRPLTWTLNSLLHLGLLLVFNLYPISLTILLLQLFLFDPEWLSNWPFTRSARCTGSAGKALPQDGAP
ncbi:MAG: hypothetical protein ACXVB9_12990 [Bdellovibrionota bacterium]